MALARHGREFVSGSARPGPPRAVGMPRSERTIGFHCAPYSQAMTRMLPFTKMHGIGNDYVYVNGFEHVIGNPKLVARGISDRHRGVGSDGLILVLPPG